MRKSTYRMPTVTFAAMTDVSVKIAKLYLELHDWKALQIIMLEERKLPQKTLAGQKRVFAEIRFQLEHLSEEEMLLLSQSELVTQRLLIHLAACKAYRFLHNFIVSVLREKMLVYADTLNNFDFHRFWDEESLLHPEVARLGEVSQQQIRRAVFRFLAEIGLTDSNKEPKIQTPWVSHELGTIIGNKNPEWLKIFLLSDQQIKDFL